MLVFKICTSIIHIRKQKRNIKRQVKSNRLENVFLITSWRTKCATHLSITLLKATISIYTPSPMLGKTVEKLKTLSKRRVYSII